jgi:UDP-galactopyranose mutase
MNNVMDPVVIIGAGLSGAVLAERCAAILKRPVIIIDQRDHVAGNCYDYIDDNGIMLSKYGAHIFHTSDEKVWRYVNTFSNWVPYEHKVLSNVEGKLVPIPVNIDTVNTLLGLHIKTPTEMIKWVNKQSTGNMELKNSEEAALSVLGNKRLYELMFKNYTFKQWSIWPIDLEPSVLLRIPIHSDFDDRYFHDTYEAIPENGYTEFVNKLLSNPLIKVILGVDYNTVKSSLPKYHKLIYTGPIDHYFEDKYDKLQYRSIRFEFETLNMPSYQATAVVNYPSLNVPYTRIVEYKKLYGSVSENTVISREYPCWDGEPYYPVPTQGNRDLYNKYREEADTLEDVIFVGRLANYKYFNMDQAIKNSLDIFEKHLLHQKRLN